VGIDGIFGLSTICYCLYCAVNELLRLFNRWIENGNMMNIEKKVLLTTIVLIVNMCFHFTIYAQSEHGDILNNKESNLKLDNKLHYDRPDLESINDNKFNFIKPPIQSYYKYDQKDYLLTRFSKFRSISFVQTKKEDSYLGLGEYAHYANRVAVNRNNKFSFALGFGLAKQSTISSCNSLSLHYSFSSNLEYEIAKGVSIYIYGQYLTSPLNKERSFIDPFLSMNPLFLQTETGAGVKAEFKNIKADVGMKSIHDTQFKQKKSLKTMNTNVKFSF